MTHRMYVTLAHLVFLSLVCAWSVCRWRALAVAAAALTSGTTGMILSRSCPVVPDVEGRSVSLTLCVHTAQVSPVFGTTFFLLRVLSEGIAGCEFSAGYRGSECSYSFLPAPLLRC